MDKSSTQQFLAGSSGRGDVTVLLDALATDTATPANNLKAGVEYTPYGEILRSQGAIANLPFRFQSKWALGQNWAGAWPVDLLDFGRRAYAPALGRFISRDPIGEAGGANLYHYCGNDPINKIDPIGMAPEKLPTMVVIADRWIEPPELNSMVDLIFEGLNAGGGGGADGGTSSGGTGGGAPGDESEKAPQCPEPEQAPRTPVQPDPLASIGQFAGGLIAGVVESFSGQAQPNPSGEPEYFGRKTGRAVGQGIELFGIYAGGSSINAGGAAMGVAGVAEVLSGGATTLVSAPLAVGGAVAVAGGTVIAGASTVGLVNSFNLPPLDRMAQTGQGAGGGQPANASGGGSSQLSGAEAARAALGKGPNSSPGSPLTSAMKSALQDNLAAAQNNLAMAKQGLNRAGNAISPEQAERAAKTAQDRIDEINRTLQSGCQAGKN